MRRCFPATRHNLRQIWAPNRVSNSTVRQVGDGATPTIGDEPLLNGDDQSTTTPSQHANEKENGPNKNPAGDKPLLSAASLPLSPLMDPKLITARERFRTPKPAPSGELSPFSKKLKNNPYGNIFC